MASTEAESNSGSFGFWSVAGLPLPADAKRRWTFERLIAEGGTGFVHQVFDRLMERRVALKILKPELVDTEDGVDLFLQEPRVAARLPHPHIVPIYEVGRHQVHGCFFTMELVQGEQLEELIRDPAEGEWGPAQALPLLDVFQKACDALAFAHSRGVVHADLKPENIRIGGFGQVYLMDWGLARVVDHQMWALDPISATEEPDLLSSPAVVPGVSGTPAYMAPEMMRGEPPGRRTDIFALGVTLYRIVTGERPFPGRNISELLSALRRGEIVPPRAARHGAWIPPELERIVLKALAQDPAERYSDASALAADLRGLTRFGAHFPAVEFSTGDRITRAGETPDATYVIVKGRCGVYGVANRAEVLLDELGPGQVIGEEAILADGGASLTTTVALEPTSASRLTRGAMDIDISTMAPWIGTVLKALGERNRGALAQQIRARQAIGYLTREGLTEADVGTPVRPDRTALDRRLSSSRLLSAFAEGASQGHLLEQVCDYLFESFRSVIPFDRLGVALLEEDGRVVRARWCRPDEGGTGISPGYSAPLAGSSLENIARTRQPRFIGDLGVYLAEHPRSESTRLIMASGVRSSLTCPLVVADAAVGFIFFSSRRPGTYRDEHVQRYLRVADDVSALVNAADASPSGLDPGEVLSRLGSAMLGLSGAGESERDEVRLLAEVARRSRDG
ncbi:MAG: protein kinase domain-containing protein, partial [Planctomycetota bacterium]